MTATVTDPRLADMLTFCERMPFQRKTPGQLWERVAEAKPTYSKRIEHARFHVNVRARMNEIWRSQGAPVGNYGTNGPRAMIDGEYTAPRHASGIIRAGERIK